MMDAIRKEIEKIEKSTERIKVLSQGNPSLLRNAEILLTFVYILKFITPETGKEEN
ncbi:MAG: hypothetical protein MUO29_03460 [Desulfobacterales bacterium]|nr:hypothetical protein [Desulfobacterales bacterium]